MKHNLSYKRLAARDRALSALLRCLIQAAPHGDRGLAVRRLSAITGLSGATLYRIAELNRTPRPAVDASPDRRGRLEAPPPCHTIRSCKRERAMVGRRKNVAAVMAGAIQRTLDSPAYMVAFGDAEERTWMLVEALCEELHPLGSVVVPSIGQVEKDLDRMLRDEAIWRAFDGLNYAELAAEHKLTTRTVRTIVERMRKAATREDAV